VKAVGQSTSMSKATSPWQTNCGGGFSRGCGPQDSDVELVGAK